MYKPQPKAVYNIIRFHLRNDFTNEEQFRFVFLFD